ncbi:MAG: hypothetical protein J7K53_12230 [Bacteroidales bacterium]|nr:hypothetical protein [Bacteroidales bacterium]
MKREEIIQLKDKIRNSDGIKCIDRMNYHNSCISILSGNFAELSKELLHFENLKNALELMDQNNVEATEKYQDKINRLLHNFLASAKTLIDHTRIFIKRHYTGTVIQKLYTQKIKDEFRDDGLSKFIQDLRNFILHNGLPYTGLMLQPDLETTVFLNRDLMLDWDNWTTLSKRYLSSQPEKIRIYNFVEAYIHKVDAFNQWLNLEIKKYHKKDLEELDSLREHYREISKNFS